MLSVHEVVKQKKNRAVFFLSSPTSYHSVSKIKPKDGHKVKRKDFPKESSERRNFLYGSYCFTGKIFKPK